MMAVSKQSKRIDPEALARSFADDVSAIPEVKRVWYWSKVGHHSPGILSLDLFVLLTRSSETILDEIDLAARTVHDRFPTMMLAVNIFTEDQVVEFGVEDELRDGSIELTLSEARH